jgi:hypothetical protein
VDADSEETDLPTEEDPVSEAESSAPGFEFEFTDDADGSSTTATATPSTRTGSVPALPCPFSVAHIASGVQLSEP